MSPFSSWSMSTSTSSWQKVSEADLTIQNNGLHTFNADGSLNQLIMDNSHSEWIHMNGSGGEGKDSLDISLNNGQLVFHSQQNPTGTALFNLDTASVEQAVDSTGAFVHYNEASNSLMFAVAGDNNTLVINAEDNGFNRVAVNADGSLGNTITSGSSAPTNLANWLNNADQHQNEALLFTDGEQAYRLDFANGNWTVQELALSELNDNHQAQVVDTQAVFSVPADSSNPPTGSGFFTWG